MAASTYVLHRRDVGSPVELPGTPAAAPPPGWRPAPPAAAPTPGADGPHWDVARGTYIQYDRSSGTWVQWDDHDKAWKPIEV